MPTFGGVTRRVYYKAWHAGYLRLTRLELAGSPRRIRSNFTNGLKSLPVRVEPVL